MRFGTCIMKNMNNKNDTDVSDTFDVSDTSAARDKSEISDNRIRKDSGKLYSSREFFIEQIELKKKLARFNALALDDFETREKMVQEIFASAGKNCFIETPVTSSWGCSNVHLGDGVYCNFNVSFVDDTDIYIGDGVMIGPNVTFTTTGHPISSRLRNPNKNTVYSFSLLIRVKNSAWIGANAVIMPGVTIGENSVVGAGSVVTSDIPDNSVACGVPCRVMREICERDEKYYFRDMEIDI